MQNRKVCRIIKVYLLIQSQSIPADGHAKNFRRDKEGHLAPGPVPSHGFQLLLTRLYGDLWSIALEVSISEASASRTCDFKRPSAERGPPDLPMACFVLTSQTSTHLLFQVTPKILTNDSKRQIYLSIEWVMRWILNDLTHHTSGRNLYILSIWATTLSEHGKFSPLWTSECLRINVIACSKTLYSCAGSLISIVVWGICLEQFQIWSSSRSVRTNDLILPQWRRWLQGAMIDSSLGFNAPPLALKT